MVIISVALVGITRIMNLTSVAGTDPLIEKQALSIAESILEEIELQAYTFCDPDDPKAADAQVAAVAANGCTDAALVQGLGPTTYLAQTETRTGNPRFDNVGDYHGFSSVGVTDMAGNVIPALSAYTINVNEEVVGNAIRIDVTVTRAPITVTLTGYRYLYAPRSVP